MSSNTQTATASDIVQPLTFLSVEQLYAIPEELTEYVVSNLLPTSGLSVLVGKPKAGKSTIARQLAVCVAQGSDFLERKTARGVVLYMPLEEKASEVKAHFKTLGLIVGENVRTYCAPVMKNGLPRLEAALKAMPDVKLVIIDPILKFIKVGDSNDYVKVSDAFEPLLKLARDYKVHIMAVHHMKKRLAEDALDNTLGSTALAAAVDTFIGIQRNEVGIRTMCSRQRYGTEMEETQLNWDEESRSLSLGVTCEKMRSHQGKETIKRIENDMINYIGRHTGCTQEAIWDAVVGNLSIKKRVMRTLFDTKNLERQGSGQKGDPYKYTVCVPTDA